MNISASNAGIRLKRWSAFPRQTSYRNVPSAAVPIHASAYRCLPPVGIAPPGQAASHPHRPAAPAPAASLEAAKPMLRVNIKRLRSSHLDRLGIRVIETSGSGK
jgi:hypothetical protein